MKRVAEVILKCSQGEVLAPAVYSEEANMQASMTGISGGGCFQTLEGRDLGGELETVFMSLRPPVLFRTVVTELTLDCLSGKAVSGQCVCKSSALVIGRERQRK